MGPDGLTIALCLLALQGVMGAFDTLYYHEWHARLPSTRGAARELRLHALRDGAYAILFGSLAWLEPRGWYTVVLAILLLTEIVITMLDFLEEDAHRPLPAGERVMHSLMAIVYGAFLAYLLPEMWTWWQQSTALVPHSHGWLSYIMTAMACGVLASGIRDWIAANSHTNRAATHNG